MRFCLMRKNATPSSPPTATKAITPPRDGQSTAVTPATAVRPLTVAIIPRMAISALVRKSNSRRISFSGRRCFNAQRPRGITTATTAASDQATSGNQRPGHQRKRYAGQGEDGGHQQAEQHREDEQSRKPAQQAVDPHDGGFYAPRRVDVCRNDAEGHLQGDFQREEDRHVEHQRGVGEPARDLVFRLLDGPGPRQPDKQSTDYGRKCHIKGLAPGLLQQVVEADHDHHDQYDGFHYSSIFLRRRRTTRTSTAMMPITSMATTVLLTSVVVRSEAVSSSRLSTVPSFASDEASRTSRICRW